MMHTHMILALTPIVALNCALLAGEKTPDFICEPPQLIGSLNGFNNPHLMKIDANFAYIIDDGEERLSIVDLSDPFNPTLLSRIEVPYYPQSISINGDAAYLLHDDYFSIFNIEDKSDPWFRRFFPTNNEESLPHSDSHIFLNEFALNIERPFAPGIDRYDMEYPFDFNPTHVRGDTLYTEDLSEYDISNPLAPVLANENI